MSFHNKPEWNTPDVQTQLANHGLPADQPSQLADSFRCGYFAQDAKIKLLVEALEHCKECAGDTVTMPTSVIHVICDAALAAAKETT